MKKLIILLLLLFVGANTIAQKLEAFEDIKLETEEDYKAQEALVLESIKWIQETPLSTEPAKRKEINSFLFEWMTDTPSLTIELMSELIPKECNECLLVYLAGWTKYSLENDYSQDKIECAMAAAESTIAFYKKNKATLGTNSDIEKMIKQQKKGKLRKRVEGAF